MILLYTKALHICKKSSLLGTQVAPGEFFFSLKYLVGVFESPKCDVNPQPNTRGIGPLVGRTSGNRHSVMHVLVEIFSITYNFSFIHVAYIVW